MGRQWFAISRLDVDEARRGVERASGALETFLEFELSRLNLPSDRLALVGFSQGTMMALHAALRATAKPAAVVGFSGMLAGEAPALGADAPPVLLVHGAADPVIPVQALFDAAGRLGAAGAAVQWHVSPGLGHSIDETGLALAALHLSMAFRGQLRPRGPAISCAIG
jgi:phospholipase/carboxylesterase